MGRRKNNPDLVEELISQRWTMDDDEFEEKYNSLSSSDMSLVSDAIDGMEDEWTSDNDYDDDDDGGNIKCVRCCFNLGFKWQRRRLHIWVYRRRIGKCFISY